MKHFILTLIVGLSSIMSSDGASFTEDDIIDAYIYGFPLVLMDTTKNVLTDTSSVTERKAPINQFLYKKTFPDPSFTEVVSPNADTLYSQAWLDISKDPMILTVPEMGNRYYLFPLIDEWTNVFFSPGTRTTGNGKGSFAITGPNFEGPLPEGVERIKAPTDIVWVLGRIQTNGAADYEAVNKLQEQFKLTPLSKWGISNTSSNTMTVKDTSSSNSDEKTSPSNIDGKTPPIEQVLKMEGVEFFKKLAGLLKTVPIPKEDLDYVKQFSEFGLVPGDDFDPKTLTFQQIQDLNAAAKKAQTKIKEEWDKHPFAVTENGWGVMIKDIGNYGTNYEVRAAVAFGGLGANLPEDAIYPVTNLDSNGQFLNGKFRYLIHFNKDNLPPVKAFWSLTVYNQYHFFVKNALNRYAIGDRDVLKFNADGSLDIYLQNTPPGNLQSINWLPTPSGDFNLLFRLYSPKEEALNGTWKPPEVKKIN